MNILKFLISFSPFEWKCIQKFGVGGVAAPCRESKMTPVKITDRLLLNQNNKAFGWVGDIYILWPRNTQTCCNAVKTKAYVEILLHIYIYTHVWIWFATDKTNCATNLTYVLCWLQLQLHGNYFMALFQFKICFCYGIPCQFFFLQQTSQ